MVIENGFNKLDLKLAYTRVEQSWRRRQSPKRAFNNENYVILKLPFTSDSCLRKIKRHVREQRLPFKIVTTPGTKLSSLSTASNML